MHAYKSIIDCEKLTSDFFGEISSRVMNSVGYAARSNYQLQEMGKPLYEFEMELLNLQEMDDYTLNDFIDNLPNLNQQTDYELYTGISYNFKFDLYKFRNRFLLRDITNKIHAKGGKVETFSSERLNREEAGALLDVDFRVEQF